VKGRISVQPVGTGHSMRGVYRSSGVRRQPSFIECPLAGLSRWTLTNAAGGASRYSPLARATRCAGS